MTECFCGYKIVAHMARHQRTCKKFAIQTLQEKYIAKIESLKRRLGEDGDPEDRGRSGGDRQQHSGCCWEEITDATILVGSTYW